jgi:hypothetical protein
MYDARNMRSAGLDQKSRVRCLGEPIVEKPAEDQGFDLVDLDGVGVAEIMLLEPKQVAYSLRRILEEIDHPQDAVAGWQSAL